MPCFFARCAEMPFNTTAEIESTKGAPCSFLLTFCVGITLYSHDTDTIAVRAVSISMPVLQSSLSKCNRNGLHVSWQTTAWICFIGFGVYTHLLYEMLGLRKHAHSVLQ